MAIALTLQAVDVTLSKTTLICKLALSGNYPTNGDTIDFSALIGQADGMEIFIASGPCTEGEISTSTGAGTGWMGAFMPGTLITNAKVKFIVSSTGAEHANGAYSAALAADPNIVGTFVFEKFL